MFNETAKVQPENSGLRECLPNYEHQIQQHKQALESNKVLQSAILSNLQYGALRACHRQPEIEQLVYAILGMLTLAVPKGTNHLEQLMEEAEKH